MNHLVARGMVVLGAALTLAGCVTIPADPEGTLDRVRTSRELRVGASPSEGLVVLDAENRVSGPEADLATAFADTLGATVAWRPGGEEELVAAMEAGELDLIVGGLTDRSPWADKVALTRPYATGTRQGGEVKRVLAVPLGENATLFALEAWLDTRPR